MMRTPDIAAEQLVPTQADQVLSNAVMPYRATFFPLGFPIEIVTNSPAIIEAASESWAMCQQRFDHPPLTLRLGVSEDCDESAPLPPEPVCRIQQHLLSNIADPYNFVHCDLNAGFAFGWVTHQTVASTLYLRHHIIEAAILAMLAALHAASLHAACVTIHGHGMLLCGDAGAGKSSLAFAGARSGWTFTSDDASYLLTGRRDRMVVGNCHQFRLRDSGAQLFPELEGRPITPRAAGKPSIVIPTAELPGLVTSESAIIQSVVFLDRRDVTKPELIVASRENATSWFTQSPFAGTTAFAEQRTAIRHLLEVPMYELHYTDLDWAIERLNTLALTGR
jgi:hypothetical protein